ncbi:tetratricopeptide repeat protein 39B [Tetranychus urticae]|nr:tetratricopeptide repeat protein 39B [Tetranychus urticae]
MDAILRECRAHVDLFMNYQFDEAMKACESKRDQSFVFECGTAALTAIRALFSMEEPILDEAFTKIERAIAVIDRSRRKTSLVSKIWGSVNAASYTEEECHAEMMYAELNVGWILLAVLRAKSFSTLLKVVMRLRETIYIYRKCRKILEDRESWLTPYTKKNFEAGLRIGTGFFNLAISYIPARVLKLIELFGFSGTREEAFVHLKQVSIGDWGFRSPIAAMLLLAHECTVEFTFGLGEPEMSFMEEILATWDIYSKSGFGKFYRALFSFVNGRIEEAIEYYNQALKLSPSKEWSQIDFACYWGLSFSHAILGDYEKAANFANRLLKDCKWSPCTSLYMEACFRYMVNLEKKDPILAEEISKNMKQVPKSMRRVAGKSIYLEKSLVKRSQLYFLEGETLLLPVMELFYIWNIFPILGKCPKMLDRLLQTVEKEMKNFSKESKHYHKYYYLMFMKGICLRYLNYPLQAMVILKFTHCINLDRDLEYYVYLQPHACMEIGLIYRTQGDFQSSLDWLRRAKKNYRKYMNESMVYFRIHCAVHRINCVQKAGSIKENGDGFQENDEQDDEFSDTNEE